MTIGGFSPLFAPGSIAVIGASRRPEAPPTRLIRTLQSTGYEGQIFPVNTRYDTVLSLPCYGSIGDLQAVPDLAIIGIAASGVCQALAECGRSGVQNALIISAGFAETGPAGQRLQAEISDLAAKLGISILGPNSMGYANLSRGVYATFSSALATPQSTGPIAIVSQSGGIAGAVSELLERDSIGKSLVVAVGNEAGLDMADVLSYAASQPDTRAVCVYAENLRRAEHLLDAVERVTAGGTSVILLIGGLTAPGARAAKSHTGALASEPFVVRQLFADAGAILAASVEQVASLAAAVAADWRAWPSVSRRGRIAIIATSGGYGVLGADAAERQGLEVPEFTDRTLTTLNELMPPYIKVGNPVDLPPDVITNPSLTQQIARAVAEDENMDAIVVVGAMHTGAAGATASTLAAALSATARPAMALWLSANTQIRQAYADADIGCAQSTDDAFRVVAHRLGSTGVTEREDAPHAEPEGLPQVLVTEVELKRELAELHVSVPAGKVVHSAGEAASAADQLGFPVVAKGVSRQVAHKAAAGLVILPIHSQEELAVACHSLSERLEQIDPAGTGDVLIEHLVEPGLEIFVGFSRDQAFGELVLLGAGGASVEARAEARLHVARAGKLALGGYRMRFVRRTVDSLPQVAGDLSASLGQLIGQVLETMNRHPDLLQLELNPIIWSGGSLTVVDALAVAASPTAAAMAARQAFGTAASTRSNQQCT